MSIVVLGGNECMERTYKDLCRAYGYKVKVYTKMSAGIKALGSPDILLLFTNAMSHKMLQCALRETDHRLTRVIRSPSDSASALKRILSAQKEMK